MSRPRKHDGKGTDFAQRLEKEMASWGMNQASLAIRLGVSPGTVSGWFTKQYLPQPRILRGIADIFGVEEDWLAHGIGQKLNEQSRRVGEAVAKILPIPHHGSKIPTREIPLISWAQAGVATEFEEIPEDWQERVALPVSDPRAFAIQLRGDSMEPRFQDGDIAVLLPGTAARNGDLVVANIKEEGFAFKILNLVGGDPEHIRLTSYNSVYSPMDYPRTKFHWIYPVDSVTKRIRR